MIRGSLRAAVAWGLLVAAPALVLADRPTVVSTLDDQERVAVTVYDAGRGMVTDVRTIELPAGELSLELRDVAERIIAETVGVEPGPGVMVLEQNYEYDLLSPTTLLEKYVGREIVMEWEQPGTPPAERELVRVGATLLSTNNGTVWRIEDRIVLNPPYRRLLFPDVPTSLRDRPTLVWLLRAGDDGSREVRTSYLTRGMSWRADYVLSLDESGETARLQGWATVDNQSGTTYADARLRLIAGEVHTVAEGGREMAFAKMTARAPEVEQEAFSEYHLYTIPRPVTLKQNQTKQVSFLETDGVRVARAYRVELGTVAHTRQRSSDIRPVRTFLSFDNRKENALGVPLPAGVVRTYRRHTDGSDQFVGEDRVDHTPRDEAVTVQLGEAFDLVAEARQTDYTRVANDVSETSWEVELRNHKDENVVIDVRASFYGDWELIRPSREHHKLSASTVEWNVPVSANGEVVLEWTVRTKW